MPHLYIVIGSIGIIALSGWSVLPMHAHALNLSASIGDQSTAVLPGEQLQFEVRIQYPDNTLRQDLRVEYQVLEPARLHAHEEKGEVIASERVLRAILTEASYLDYITVPQDAKSGLHELGVIVEDYQDLHREAFASFEVLRGIDKVQRYFFILVGAILLMGVLISLQVQMMLRARRT